MALFEKVEKWSFLAEPIVLQLFLIPWLTHVSCCENNWTYCSNLVAKVVQIPGAGNDLSGSFHRWVISVASMKPNDDTETNLAKSIKINVPESIAHHRMWAIQTLACVVDKETVTISTLVSLFDDPSYQIRLHVAHVLAILCLNMGQNRVLHSIDLPCHLNDFDHPFLSSDAFDFFLLQFSDFLENAR